MRYFAACLLFAALAAAQVPVNLRVPEGQTLVFEAQGEGSQIYVCKNGDTGFAWTLRAPAAKLTAKDGSPLGRHFAGPTWESTDGSSVVGKVTASVPSPDAGSIPWLLLSAVDHAGEGIMNRVLTIQRLNTKGGKAPAGGCDAAHDATEIRVPYQAGYFFYGK